MTECFDHITIVGHSLDQNSEIFKSLGFNLARRSQVQGAESGPHPGLWGIANECAMLENSYIELSGVVDESKFNSALPDLLSRYAGIRVLVFGTTNIEQTRNRLIGRGIQATDIIETQRDVSTLSGTRTAKFRGLRVSSPEFNEARISFVEHQTKGLLWYPQALVHKNQAKKILDVLITVESAKQSSERFTRLLGGEPASNNSGCTLRLPDFRLSFVEPSYALGKKFFSGPALPTPSVPGFMILVDSLSDIRQRVKDLSLPNVQVKDSIVIPAPHCGGAFCVFTENPEAQLLSLTE